MIQPSWLLTKTAAYLLLRPRVHPVTVLELGSGMGLTGLSLMAAAGPASVTLSDRDPEVLAMAAISIADNGFAESMATLPLDWQDKSQWPAQNLFDTFVRPLTAAPPPPPLPPRANLRFAACHPEPQPRSPSPL